MKRRAEMDDDFDDFENAEAIEGGEAAKKKLLPWLRQKIDGNVETEEAVVSITLCQTAHGTDKILKKEEFEIGADSVEEVLDVMLDFAEDDAAAYSGITRYSLKLAVNGKVVHQNFRLTNLASGPSGDGSRNVGDELNDPRSVLGIVGQQMRHSEALADKVIHLAGSNQDALREENKELRAENKSLRQQLLDGIPMLAEVHDLSFRKALAIKEKEDSMQLKQQVAGSLLQIAPLLLGAVGAGGIAGALGPAMAGMGGPPPGAPMPPPGQVSTQATPIEASDDPLLRQLEMHVAGLMASLSSRPDKLAALSKNLDQVDVLSLFQIKATIEQLQAARQGSPPSPPSSPTHSTNGASDGGPSVPGFSPFGKTAG